MIFVSLKLVWSTQRIAGQSGLHSGTLSGVAKHVRGVGGVSTSYGLSNTVSLFLILAN